MIFSQYQQAVRDRLLSDAWFADDSTTLSGVPVLAEDRQDLATEVNNSLYKLGIVGVVLEPQVRSGERGNEAIVTTILSFAEAVNSNRARDNAKTAQQACAKALALLLEWTPDEDVWTPLQFVKLEPAGVSEDGSVVLWALEMTTLTDLEVAIFVVANEGGTPLADQHGNPLLVSPTDP